jgi:hypothetical protein
MSDMAKYMLLIYGDAAQWDAMSPEQRRAHDAAHAAFRDAAGSKIIGGEELEPAPIATTLRTDPSGQLNTTDGPFLETKEALGGYYLLEAADLDEVIESVFRRALPLLVLDGSVPGPEDVLADDDRLRLVFTCCHPALSRDAQVALTLRLVCGLSTAEVARAFLVQESTMAARITRAKKKISAARIPYRVPQPDQLAERVGAVLEVVHLIFTTGHTAPVGSQLARRDLVDSAIGLARMLHLLMPNDSEISALLALLLLIEARASSRVSATGRMLLLSEQDRSRWDTGLTGEVSVC